MVAQTPGRRQRPLPLFSLCASSFSQTLSSYRTHIFSDSLCAPNARIGLITQKMLNKCVLNLQNTWAKKDTEDGEFQRMLDRWDLNTFALGTLGNELG